MTQDDKTQGITPEATTTGRTGSTMERSDSTTGPASPSGAESHTVQPGSDPVRPVNPDRHGQPGHTQPTQASRLEEEAATTTENRY